MHNKSKFSSSLWYRQQHLDTYVENSIPLSHWLHYIPRRVHITNSYLGNALKLRKFPLGQIAIRGWEDVTQGLTKAKDFPQAVTNLRYKMQTQCQCRHTTCVRRPPLVCNIYPTIQSSIKTMGTINTRGISIYLKRKDAICIDCTATKKTRNRVLQQKQCAWLLAT